MWFASVELPTWWQIEIRNFDYQNYVHESKITFEKPLENYGKCLEKIPDIK